MQAQTYFLVEWKVVQKETLSNRKQTTERSGANFVIKEKNSQSSTDYSSLFIPPDECVSMEEII